MSGKALVKHKVSFLAPEGAESYLPAGIKDDLGNLTPGDYKTPRIILLQGGSPMVKNFPGVALADHFWHTGMNVDLGDEFYFVVCTMSKKVILWRPRWDGEGGILAFSRDAVTWEFGGDKTFTVHPDKNNRDYKVEWKTGKNVIQSGLTKWGTFDPLSEKSGPAAQEVYEYLCYLPEHPELSPVLMSVQRTGVPNAKNLNTSLAYWTKDGKPKHSLCVLAYAEPKSGDGNTWTVPNFRPLNKQLVSEEVYKAASAVVKEWKDFTTTTKDYEQPDDNGIPAHMKDIPF